MFGLDDQMFLRDGGSLSCLMVAGLWRVFPERAYHAGPSPGSGSVTEDVVW